MVLKHLRTMNGYSASVAFFCLQEGVPPLRPVAAQGGVHHPQRGVRPAAHRQRSLLQPAFHHRLPLVRLGGVYQTCAHEQPVNMAALLYMSSPLSLTVSHITQQRVHWTDSLLLTSLHFAADTDCEHGKWYSLAGSQGWHVVAVHDGLRVKMALANADWGQSSNSSAHRQVHGHSQRHRPGHLGS